MTGKQKTDSVAARQDREAIINKPMYVPQYYKKLTFTMATPGNCGKL